MPVMDLTNQQVAEAVVAWGVSVIPDVAGNTYDSIPLGKPKALPDLVVEITAEEQASGGEFPWAQLQQTDMWVWRVQLLIMVDAGAEDEEAALATESLRSYGEALKRALFSDPTLGSRVFAASPSSLRIDYTPPFVEWDQGPRGREMTVTLTVGEPIGAAW